MPRLLSARTLVLGGLALAAYGAMKNKRAISGLLGGGSEPGGSYGPAPAPPVANADVAGPPENTATHVPAPEPVVHAPGGGIDEAAEEAAAAAEAANIGGTPAEYPSEEDPARPADEALRPLEEAGEGYSEGAELADADLVDHAEQDQPQPDEQIDAPPPTGAPADVPPPEDAVSTSAAEKSSAVWHIDEQPTLEAEAVDGDES